MGLGKAVCSAGIHEVDIPQGDLCGALSIGQRLTPTDDFGKKL
ncbi:hypothetical protein [Pelagicoccus albus]